MALAQRGYRVPASRTNIIRRQLVYVYVVLLSIAGEIFDDTLLDTALLTPLG